MMSSKIDYVWWWAGRGVAVDGVSVLDAKVLDFKSVTNVTLIVLADCSVNGIPEARFTRPSIVKFICF